MTIHMDEIAAVNRLSAAPWPAYVECRGVVFGLPRKCASNTMKLALEQLGAWRYLVPAEVRVWRGSYVAVVRHPISRLQGVWRHAIVRNRGQYIKLPANMSWEDFVDHVCNTNDEASNYHYRSYSDELIAITGRTPGEVLRCEDLQAGFDALCGALGWAHVRLKRLNATTGPAAPVTEAMRTRLAVRYFRDFANFDYTP